MELALNDQNFILFKPSQLACAAIYLVHKIRYCGVCASIICQEGEQRLVGANGAVDRVEWVVVKALRQGALRTIAVGGEIVAAGCQKEVQQRQVHGGG